MCIGLGFLYTQSGQYYITLPHIDISDWQLGYLLIINIQPTCMYTITKYTTHSI